MVVRVTLDYQSSGSEFEITSWPYGRFRLSFYQIQSKEYQKHLRTYWLSINCLLSVVLQFWGISALSMKRGCKDFLKFYSYLRYQYIDSELVMHWKCYQLYIYCFFWWKIWSTSIIFMFRKEFSSYLIGHNFVWLKWRNFWEVT